MERMASARFLFSAVNWNGVSSLLSGLSLCTKSESDLEAGDVRSPAKEDSRNGGDEAGRSGRSLRRNMAKTEKTTGGGGGPPAATAV